MGIDMLRRRRPVNFRHLYENNDCPLGGFDEFRDKQESKNKNHQEISEQKTL